MTAFSTYVSFKTYWLQRILHWRALAIGIKFSEYLRLFSWQNWINILRKLNLIKMDASDPWNDYMCEPCLMTWKIFFKAMMRDFMV